MHGLNFLDNGTTVSPIFLPSPSLDPTMDLKMPDPDLSATAVTQLLAVLIAGILSVAALSGKASAAENSCAQGHAHPGETAVQ